MPLPPPAPLPSLAVRAQPPVYQSSNVVTFGSVRAAALAARQARQFRLKRQQQELGGLHGQARWGSTNGTVHKTAQPVPFHEKKHLKLSLNMDVVTKPEVPPMFANVCEVRNAMPVEDSPWGTMEEDVADTRRGSGFNSTTSMRTQRPSTFRPRRQSSVVLSINSPEGAEFGEVAHDGPEQLGRLTKRVKRLGKGAGGVVFLSLYLPALKLVAVKEVIVYKEQERELVKHELHALHENLVPIDARPAAPAQEPVSTGVWTQLRMKLSNLTKSSASSSAEPEACPYLVGFYGAYLLPAKCAISIVMEFMDMGSVQDLLDARVAIPESVLRHCAYCCMAALEHMHRHRMIHRDIKPANILMNSKGEFKIADFGLAGTLSKSESFFSEFEGTMMYMAPERIQGQHYSYVSDLWSMGVSLFYLATGAYPFAVEEGFFGLEEAIVNDPLPPMPNRFSPDCRDFIKGLLRRDPAQRTSAAQALAHPFLRGYATSDTFRTFSTVWDKMPLSHVAIKAEDTATIAQLMADFTQRQKQRASRRASGISKRASMRITGSALVGGDAQQFDREALASLADACGVDANELQRLYDRELACQSE